jgi:hypothetical protein
MQASRPPTSHRRAASTLRRMVALGVPLFLAWTFTAHGEDSPPAATAPAAEIEQARAAQAAAKEQIARARLAQETARASLAEAVAAEEKALRFLAETEAKNERAAREIAEARMAEAIALRKAAEAVAERESLASEVAELELRDALARLARAEERLAEEARLVDLFRRANQLRSDEAALAARMERALPLPASAFDLGPAELRLDRVEELISERDRLRAERGDLRAALPEGAPIGAEPYSLLLAEANFALHYSKSADNLERAGELFREAAQARPDLPEPMLGLGLAALRAGRPSSATELLRDAAEATKSLRGEEHPDYMRALSLLREASLSLTDEDPSFIRQYKRSLDVLEPHWSEMSILLANNWRDAGDAERSLQYSLPAIDFAATTRGANHPGVADAHVAAADGLKALGQWNAASEHILKALEIRQEKLGAEHPLTAETLADAGSMSRLVARPEQAETFFRRALAIREKALGEEHPLVAATKNNVALALMDQGRYGEAEPLLRAALAAVTKSKGEDHPFRATLLANLAGCLLEEGNQPEAAKLYREAHLARSRTLGANHPLTLRAEAEAKALEDLDAKLAEAEAAYDAKRWPEAAAAFEAVAAMVERRLAESRSDAAESLDRIRLTSLYNAACSLALAGDVDAAFARLEEAIDAGFADADHLRADPDLEALRADRLRLLKAVRRIEGEEVETE